MNSKTIAKLAKANIKIICAATVPGSDKKFFLCEHAGTRFIRSEKELALEAKRGA